MEGEDGVGTGDGTQLAGGKGPGRGVATSSVVSPQDRLGAPGRALGRQMDCLYSLKIVTTPTA